MNELKTLQEELIKVIPTRITDSKANPIEFANIYSIDLEKALEKAHTLGLMKGVELVEGVVEKEASAKHDNHEDWQDGDCDCDGVFDYWEIRRLTDKLKQELK